MYPFDSEDDRACSIKTAVDHHIFVYESSACCSHLIIAGFERQRAFGLERFPLLYYAACFFDFGLPVASIIL